MTGHWIRDIVKLENFNETIQDNIELLILIVLISILITLALFLEDAAMLKFLFLSIMPLTLNSFRREKKHI